MSLFGPRHDTKLTHPAFKAHRSGRRLSSALVLTACGLFATAAALAVVRPSEPPVVQTTQTRLTLPQLAPEALAPAEQASPFIQHTTIRRGDTLAALLQRLEVDAPGLLGFLTHDKSARSIYKLMPGRQLKAALDADGRLQWLRYHHTPGVREGTEQVAKWLEVIPAAEGYQATEERVVLRPQLRVAAGEITSSLFGATDAADIPDSVTLQMAGILGSKIDFLRDLRTGDNFRVAYEVYTHQGRDAGAGRVLALEFRNDKKLYEAAWFQGSDSAGGYYDFDGRSLRGAFLRSALQFSRISSTFGGRRHPISGKWRDHKGVDYAAPTGTPIHATGDGVVESIGWQNGYGKTIVLRHHDKYSTLYAHQSRFAQGLKKGDRVQQGQLIGYVGSTGWSTGPHLHYEFRVAGKPVDPLSIELPVARTLTPADQRQFKTVLTGYQQQLALMAGPSTAESTDVAAR